MLFRQISRDDKAAVFVAGQNAAGETVTVGAALCWDWRNAASHGNAVVKPTTSGLGLYAGVNAFGYPGSYKDWPSNSYGLVQVYGVHNSALYHVGAASLSCAGQFLVPANGSYSGQTVVGLGTFTSNALVAARGAFLLTNDLSGSGFAQAFVRAL